MYRYFVIYKPYNMLSQFVSPYPHHRLLGDLDYDFPEGTHAIGRLDDHSEGLLILTTDRSVTRRLMHPSKKHARKYLVHVQREVTQETLTVLREGVMIEVKRKGDYFTQPCSVTLLDEPPLVHLREDPYTEYVPHTWLEFNLTEGKNRQIRKMCKMVGHRCKRLIRTHIEDLSIDGYQPGEVREFNKDELFALLKI